jgi:hypothetical protein
MGLIGRFKIPRVAICRIQLVDGPDVLRRWTCGIEFRCEPSVDDRFGHFGTNNARPHGNYLRIVGLRPPFGGIRVMS